MMDVIGSSQLFMIELVSMLPLSTCMVLFPQIPLIINLPLMHLGSSSDLEQLNANSPIRVTNKNFIQNLFS